MGEYTDKEKKIKKLRQEIEGLRAIPVMRFNSESLGLPSVTDKESELI